MGALAERAGLHPAPPYWIKRRQTWRDDILSPSVVHHADERGRPACAEARALHASPWWGICYLDRDTVEQLVAALPDHALHRPCWAPDTVGDEYMSMDLARRDDLAGMNLAQQLEFAEKMAEAGLLPDVYRGKPANVLLAMQYGSALAVPTMTAILGVHVIDGRQVPSAHLVGGLVRRAGHRLRVGTRGGNVADLVGWATIIRGDDPGHEYRAEWTVQRAEEADLVEPRPGKGRTNWQKHPWTMVKRRAVYEVANDACPEVLLGIDLGSLGPQIDDMPVADEQPVDVSAAADDGDVVDAVIVGENEGDRLGRELAGLDFYGLRLRLNAERERLGLEWSDAEADFAETFDGIALRSADVDQLRAFVAGLAVRVRT